MLDLAQIESFYPPNLRSFKRNLIREYLQYKILEAIYSSKQGEKLSFMGGTAIHIIHSINRFSEDLDFDNRGLDRDGFDEMTRTVAKKLRLEGYKVEVKNSFKGAYRSFINILNVLYESKLSRHKGEKLLIQIDAEPQEFSYNPDKVIINKFDVFCSINVVPIELLLAQKIYAIFMRKRPMGRDFYDTIYLLGKADPDMDYMRVKLGIKDKRDMMNKLIAKCGKMNFESLSADVEPFLFVPADAKKVTMFQEYVKGKA